MAGAVAVGRARRRHVGVIGTVLALGVMIGGAPHVGASEIQTIICRTPSEVTVEQPANDAVVTNGAVSLSGTVRQANQLEVYMDGTLDSVVPLGVADTSYNATVQLEAGTHTVKVVSIDPCQLGNGEASVVITYQPAVPSPSVGAAVPTVVGGETSGVRVGAAPQAAPSSPSFLPPAISRPLHQLGNILDLDVPRTTVSTGGQSPQVSQLIRFSLVTGSGLLLIFSQAISSAGASGTFLQFAASRLGMGPVSGSRLLTILGAVVGMALAFLL